MRLEDSQLRCHFIGSKLGLMLYVIAVAFVAANEAATAAPLPPTPLMPGQRVSPSLTQDKAGAFAAQEYAQRFNVSRSESERRLRLQTTVDDLKPKLIEQLGRGFGQLHFDNDAGTYVVALGPSGREDDARRVLDAYGLSSTVVTKIEVDHEQFRAGIETLSEQLRRQLRPGIAEAGLAVRAAEVTIAADATPEERQRVTEIVAAATIPVRKKTSSADTLLTRPPQSAMSCSVPYCNQLVAGVKYGTWAATCTASFYSGPVGVYYPRFLSAGHCTLHDQPPGLPPWWSCRPNSSNCPTAGFQQAFRYGSPFGGTNSDSAVLYFNGELNWLINPGWWNWQHNARVALTATHTPVIGETLCQGGYKTTIACGQVDRTDWSGWYGPSGNGAYGETYVDGMISVANTCVNFGDSGGPVTIWHGAWATGIVSGGATPLIPDQCTYTYMRVEPIQRIQSTYGIYVYGG